MKTLRDTSSYTDVLHKLGPLSSLAAPFSLLILLFVVSILLTGLGALFFFSRVHSVDALTLTHKHCCTSKKSSSP